MNPSQKNINHPPDEIRRRDEVFSAKFRAGLVPKLETTPLDPATDPFGMNYEWLNSPQSPFDQAYDQLVNEPSEKWYRSAGSVMRTIALADTMAGGTDEQVLVAWAKERFSSICKAGGEEGEGLWRMLKRHGDQSRAFVEDVSRFLEHQPELVELDAAQRVALALIVIAQHGSTT